MAWHHHGLDRILFSRREGKFPEGQVGLGLGGFFSDGGGGAQVQTTSSTVRHVELSTSTANVRCL
jgi:hypothetical protein